ncbi:MAG: hypothetical protein WCI36_05610 [bacterium]
MKIKKIFFACSFLIYIFSLNNIASAAFVSDGKFCGSFQGQYLPSLPSYQDPGFCVAGYASNWGVMPGPNKYNPGSWFWQCGSLATGDWSSCSAVDYPIGICGSAAGVGVNTAPTKNLCAGGSWLDVANGGDVIWSKNGLCSNGTTFGCPVWKWWCNAGKITSSKYCQAPDTTTYAPIVPKKLPACSCGSSNGMEFLSQPSSNLCGTVNSAQLMTSTSGSYCCNGGDFNGDCGVGEFNCVDSGGSWDYSGDGWSWNCSGSECAGSVNCSALQKIILSPVDGSCGASNGQSLPAAPTANLCSTGSSSSSGSWSWSCLGQNGGSPASCSATQSGDCGSSNGKYFFLAPSSALCSSGAVSSVSGTGPWNWTCGGTTACGANKKYACGAGYSAVTFGIGCSNVYANTRVSAPYESASPDCSTSIDPAGISYITDCTCHSGTGSLSNLDYSSCVAPTLSLTADPNSVDKGGSSTISWSSINTTSCSLFADGILTGWASDPAFGSNIFNGIISSTSYTMKCWNTPDTSINPPVVEQSVTVGINSPVDGICGSYSNTTNDYLTLPSMPTDAKYDPVGLCSDGSTPATSGSGPWFWTCDGKSGGNPADCTAKKTCISSYTYDCSLTSTGEVCNTTDKAGQTIITKKSMCSKLDSCSAATTYPSNAECTSHGVPCATTNETLYCPLPKTVQKWQESGL